MGASGEEVFLFFPVVGWLCWRAGLGGRTVRDPRWAGEEKQGRLGKKRGGGGFPTSQNKKKTIFFHGGGAPLFPPSGGGKKKKNLFFSGGAGGILRGFFFPPPRTRGRKKNKKKNKKKPGKPRGTVLRRKNWGGPRGKSQVSEWGREGRKPVFPRFRGAGP